MKRTRSHYEQFLRDPTRELVEQIRTKYIEQLSPEVAGGKRLISILKKNDYGKGGYYDHYWFAFYDPNAGSKTKSVQLFFVLRLRRRSGTMALRWGTIAGSTCEISCRSSSAIPMLLPNTFNTPRRHHCKRWQR